MIYEKHVGADAVRERYSNFLKTLGTGDTWYVFSFFTEYQDEGLRTLLHNLHVSLIEKGVDVRLLFNEDVRSMAERVYSDSPMVALGFNQFKLPLGLIVTDDRILQFGMQPEVFLTEIVDPLLITYYRHFFLQTWYEHRPRLLIREVAAHFGRMTDDETLERINNARDNYQAFGVAEAIRNLEDIWVDMPGKGRQQMKLWSVPQTTADFLELFVVATGARKILEVGTSAGYSTLYLAMGATYTEGEVITVERLDKKIVMASDHFSQSGLKNIRLIQGVALDVLPELEKESLDLVFLDADKQNYGAYLDMVLPLLKVGGFIIADNVADFGHLMKNYLEKVGDSQAYPNLDSYVVSADNGLMITRKTR